MHVKRATPEQRFKQAQGAALRTAVQPQNQSELIKNRLKVTYLLLFYDGTSNSRFRQHIGRSQMMVWGESYVKSTRKLCRLQINSHTNIRDIS